MASHGISKIKEQYERARAQIARIRENAEHVAELGTDAIITTAGGAAAGVLAVKMPKIPGTEIDSGLAIGTLACGIALTGAAGKMARQVNAFGAGLLAVEAAKATEKALAA